MQRAAGKRFVGFPDPSHDQRRKRINKENNQPFLRFPLWNPLKKLEEKALIK